MPFFQLIAKILSVIILAPFIFAEWLFVEQTPLVSFNDSNVQFVGATGKHGEDCFYHYDGRQSETSTSNVFYFDSCPPNIVVPQEVIDTRQAQVERQNAAIQKENEIKKHFRSYLYYRL